MQINPNSSASDTRSLWIALLLFLCLLGSWAWALTATPTDAHMGEIYRLIYLHVPSAFTAFLTAFILFVVSVLSLWRKKTSYVLWGKAVCEVGLIFTALTLFSGSIWGYPTWGTYWTWDARLTTTLILAILYAGYLFLYAALPRGMQRLKVCAVCGILIFADVPIIYQSVTWWRTLHQPPSIIRSGGSTMAPEMLSALIVCALASFLVGAWFCWERYRNLQLDEAVEDSSYTAMQGK